MIAGALSDEHLIRIISRTPGPMIPDFREVAPTSIEPMFRIRRKLRSLQYGRWPAFVLDTMVAAAVLVIRRPDIVYVNSAAAAIYLRPARWFRRRSILHLHESVELIDSFLTRDRAGAEFTGVELVACSPSIRSEVASHLGRPIESVTLIPSVPDTDLVRRLSLVDPDDVYAAEDLVIGSCGAVEQRKGPDLWLDIAASVKDQRPSCSIRFVWIGAGRPPMEPGSVPGIDFLGAKANPFAHVRRFDIATLTSRDDPFPLVVIEAMTLGRPVVAFAVGGVAEQVGDTGVLVPPGDTEAFAGALVRLIDDRRERHRLGEAAQLRAAERFSTEAFGAAVRRAVSDA